jgi:hypothetical protein
VCKKNAQKNVKKRIAKSVSGQLPNKNDGNRFSMTIREVSDDTLRYYQVMKFRYHFFFFFLNVLFEKNLQIFDLAFIPLPPQLLIKNL